MASTAQIVVEYVAKTTGLQSATSDIQKSGSRVKRSFGGVGKTIAAGLAVGAVVNFGKSAITAAQESVVATSRLENVFRSMGDTTGQAAKAAENYASKLSQQTAIEDETIMAAQAILATFGKVSDATARQAGVFDRATAAAADLAAAGFGTMETNAVQLGKALQDPVKGLTSLARSGVTFTDAQKEQIKSLVESNHQLDAQKIVLAAIEKQVGGTAAATATESEKMRVAFGETQESIGKALLPALNTLAPILATVANLIAKYSGVIGPLVVGIGAAVAAQWLLNAALTANPIGAVVLAIGLLIGAILLLVKNWDAVVAALTRGWNAIKTAALSVLNWARENWPLLLTILTGPIGLAVAKIIQHWATIKATFTGAINAITGLLRQLGSFVTTVVGAIGGALNRLAGLFAGPAAAARAMAGAIAAAVGAIAGQISGVVGAVSAAVEKVVNAIKAPLNALISGWNSIRFTIPSIHIGGKKILGKTIIPDIDFGGGSFGVPSIPLLASGGIVSAPTLLVAGEGQGREIIAPESLLRQIVNERPISVRVFIGDRELTDIVRTEVASGNTGLARSLLAGAGAV